MKSFFVAVIGSACLLGMLGDTLAQSYPTKPIRILRPHPAGASGDIQARGISQALSQHYGQSRIAGAFGKRTV